MKHSGLSSLLVGLVPVLVGCSDDGTGPEEPSDPRLFSTASAGTNHTCALSTENLLMCWGLNTSGQLGDGTFAATPSPTPIGNQPFSVVSAGNAHTCALTPEGVAFCWGENHSGQLGIGSAASRIGEPHPVATDLRFSDITAGTNFTCAIDSDGHPHCWGDNAYGQLGCGEVGDTCGFPQATTPVAVSTTVRFEALALGSVHVCGVARNGGVWCWGRSDNGELGANTTEACETEWADPKPCSKTPISIEGGGSYRQVAAGSAHSCAIRESGTAVCWGSGEGGALGDGDPTGSRHTPEPVSGALDFGPVDASHAITCAVSDAGEIYCWGSGELGDGSGHNSSIPIAASTPVRFRSVTVGGGHSCGLAIEGVLYCWGSNRYGQLGDDSGSLGWATPVVVKGW